MSAIIRYDFYRMQVIESFNFIEPAKQETHFIFKHPDRVITRSQVNQLIQVLRVNMKFVSSHKICLVCTTPQP